MRLAIISDIHDNLVNLELFLSWCRPQKITSLLCCGDITNLETISSLAQNFPGEIFVVQGNAEIYQEASLSKFKNIHYYGEIGITEIDRLTIGLCHEPKKIKNVQEISPLALDFIFYGHTHKPWLEKKEETIIANPGTLGGVFNPASFAVLDTAQKNLELKILADL